jgi:hypothetical protein
MLDADKFLNPERVKSNLILSSLYLSAYELLKSAIINNIKDFFTFGFDADGKPIIDKKYNEQVRQVNGDLLWASCLWLEMNGVISHDEVEQVVRLRNHRNQIAHELPRLLIDSGLNLNIDYFVHIRQLLEKIEVWWILNFEIPSNSDFDGVEVDPQEIMPGRVVALDHLISIVLSDVNIDANREE